MAQENLEAAGLDCSAYGDVKNLEAGEKTYRHASDVELFSISVLICLTHFDSF